MLKILKKKKTAKNKDEQYPLVKDMQTHYTEASDAGEQESTVDSEMPSGSGVEVSGETGLNILRMILSKQSNPDDTVTAAAMPKIRFSQDWHQKYLQEINQFVENHFPTLPSPGSQVAQIQDFLKSTQTMICNDVCRLTPALKDAGLLVHLMDSYSRHLFTKLDLLLNRDLSVNELFLIIMWEKEVFFRYNDISTTLQNILHYDEEHRHNENSMDEETFIRVYIDVTQVALVERENMKQDLRYFYFFMYVDAENERLKIITFTEENSVYLFRIINTCMQLRNYAEQIRNTNKNDISSSTVCMLQELEDNATSIVRQIMKCLAQGNLERHFQKRNGHIDILIEAIQRQLASLPETASEIKTVVVKIAYDSVSKVYLECLMKTKFEKLEKCWGNAENKIKEDVQHFHAKFSELNGIAAQQNQLLRKMSEVLHCSDVDALKITCCELFRDFPQESEHYVPGLLRWKGVLSERQVREVLDVCRELCLNPNHTHPVTREQASEYSSQQSGVPDLIAVDVEASNKRVLNTLRKILSDQSTPEDFEDFSAEVLKTLSKLNDSNSQDVFCDYLQEIDQFVENHFPKLPAEGPQGFQVKQIQDFLKSAESMIYDEVHRLTPALRDAGLLVHLMDSYSRHLFTNLDLLLNRDLSVKEIFCLLLWGKDVFFSPDSQHFFRVDDPLLLTGWFERATEKLLPKEQNDISTTLQNILCYDEQHGHNEDSMDEETFIRVHIDVTQCLNAVIQRSKEFSHTLMCTAQTLCLKQLHYFVQEYVYAEKKRLEKQQHLKKNSMHLFRLISTCRQLRFFAPRLNNPAINNSDDFSNIILMLEELEDYVLSIVQKMMKHLAQDFLRCYFQEEDEQIQMLTKAIQKQCASLPQTDVRKEIQEIFINVTYDCVSHVYLDCLIKSELRRLEKRWGNVQDRINKDTLRLHNTFTELNGTDDQRNRLLHRMSEVLLCSDVEALKITCCDLFRDFPQDSEQYVPGLLRWKKVLSERQVREVLVVSRDFGLDPKHGCFTESQRLKLLEEEQQMESTINSAPQNSPGVKETNKTVLHALELILSDTSNTQHLTFETAVLKSWGQQNGFTVISYPQDWPCEFLQKIDQFVENHFDFEPLPTKGSQGCYNELKYFLNKTEKMICNEVLRLTPVLKDAGLLVHLKNSFSRHLFTKLDLLLSSDLLLKEIYFLIMWGKDVFFRQDSLNFLGESDPLLLTEWFEKAKRKLLNMFQNYISTTLQNILHYDEQHGHNGDSMDEETFIRVHIDVNQCLNRVILDAKNFGLTLMDEVQILCSEELHIFVQKYVKVQKKHLKTQKFTEKNSVYLFQIINTCIQLRLCATQINPNKNNIDYNASICMLQKLEDNTSSIVEKIMTCLAQRILRSYFKTSGEHIHYLTEAIQKQCASLPQNPEIKMVHNVIVKIGYDCVSKVYLECLLKRKFTKLEKCWENAEKKINKDVHHVHETFSKLNSTVVQQKQLLKRMIEVLHCSDVEGLKITCTTLFRDFPKDSQQYVPGLLRWKGVLSERQVREVLDVSQDLPRHPLKALFCCCGK
ncbi:hypothetical protein Q8A67_010967 [Cirrhinus molitorella]|uniref:Uncharacterized protein n=1 Tax=Cirrhinus molitorella TaxID=172907 RepID=A0AA88PR10_9TELE|nr:hypothetical protein Q8A67_010967 [Cirrhinus molitorella]